MRTRLCPSLFLGLLAAAPVDATTLLDAASGDSVRIDGFTYATDKRFVGELRLKRIEVYAPESKILVASPTGLEELPRSHLHAFISDGEHTASRLYLVVDPKRASFTGAVFDDDGVIRIEGRINRNGQPEVAKSTSGEADREDFQCGNDTLPPLPALLDELRPLRSPAATSSLKGGGLVAGVVAVDTDNELMNLRFGNNTTTATDYLVNLFAGLNLIYERDLGVRLVQGDVILRPSTTADPYNTTSASSSDAQLNEFAEYWRANEQARSRAFALQISGKSPDNCRSQGIASILNGKFGSRTPAQLPPDGFDDDNFCNAKGFRLNGGAQTFGHFSLARVFKGGCGSGTTADQDVSLIGHELGHTLGARHAHCTAANGSSPLDNVTSGTIDQCYRGEYTCYGCATLVDHDNDPNTPPQCPTTSPISCPNEAPFFVGQGSIMSYCNFTSPSGADCGQVVTRFHQTQTGFLDTRVADNVGFSCLTPVVANLGPTISANTPANGSTTAMSGGVQGTTTSSNISFTVSGGAGSGTTNLSCTTTGSVAIASGTPQSIPVGGSASNVVARFTLTASAQSGSVNCTATPQNGTPADLSYNFTAPAGVCSGVGDCVFQDGFE